MWAQTRRANELLGVGFAAQHGLGQIKYVLFNPVYVRTSFAGEFPASVRFFITLFGKLFAKPAERASCPSSTSSSAPRPRNSRSTRPPRSWTTAPTGGDREDAERIFRETKRLLNG
ncbi:hypothetical protein ALI22I_06095 [Saccharothrix sp. ALI-22-I]|uniref:hypothetical protein n=1 Tax=Saccharothrix sp. ALI-22-I TaxID=1933778 RepID=UPI00097C8477|nr:hypothetical protein [Saccharothrix sp. ALI-22-I]ONI92010.1 hypothetical protein ALI22I_06095 [Saccharothrix sp. ALI-22-I]